MRRLPPLSSLRAFEAVLRLGSVTRAAAELGRTHGAVSRQLATLQTAAGFPLFDKAGTGLRPNRHGEAFGRVTAAALDTLEHGWTRLRDEAGGPALHVACSATFAMRWLVPRLSDFYQKHPAVRLRLSMTTARALRFEGADLVIAWDRAAFPPADRAREVPLGAAAFGPVWAPSYPAQLAAGRLRLPVRIDHEHTSRSWDLWRAQSGHAVEAERDVRFPHTHLCIEAAAAGLGAALAERRLVRAELASGRLVAPCGFTVFPDGWAAVPVSDRAPSATAAAFIAWLRATLAPDDAEHAPAGAR